MKKRYIVFANKRRRAISASKDYATLKGTDFTKARDILTMDGYHEHEYGDKDDNTGYAVYRKGDKEVELQYRWVSGKRKGDAHAGKVTNVYVDEDINSATKVRSRRAIKASGRQLIFPFLVEGEFADGYTCEVGGNSEAECIEKLGNMENMHGELVWYSGVTDENYEAGKSVYSSSNARRVTASTKYRIDIYKRNNPDALIKRVYEMFDSEDEAYEYGESIANGDEVVVNKVNASTRLPQRRVMASNYNPNGFAVTGYYDSNYRGVAADRYFDPNELDEAAFYAHDLLSKGLYVNIIYWGTGDKVDITPDEYFDNFDGDFWCTRDLVDWRDEVYKSMGIGASTNIRSAKKITCSYDADDIVMYFNGKKVFTGKWYDIVDTIEDLCKDPDVNSAFQDWCMQYNLGNGNYDVVFDGTPRDTAAVFWSLIDNVYEESDYSDFYVDGDGILDFEIFYANQEVGIPD